MKLIIDIPEEDYIRLRDEGMFGNVTTFKRAVREGIPLEQEPCADCISRQATIDAVKGWETVPVKVLEMMPSVTPVEKVGYWIPVSERYPTDANKSYLVCYEDGCITIEHLYFDGDGNPFFSEMELGVVAWMPLPERYKASSTGAEGSVE